MAVRGETTCIKHYLVVFNCLLWICGMVLLGFGIWMWIDDNLAEVLDLESSNTTFYTTVYIMIAVGVFVALLGGLGCYGAGRESMSSLAAYFAFLLAVLIVELAVAAVIYANQNGVVSVLQNLYTYAYVKFLKTERTSLGLTLRVLHHALDCCGVTGVLDQIITNTCPARSGLAVFTLSSCPSAISTMFEKQSHVILGVCLGLGGVTILTLIFTAVLLAGIRARRHRKQLQHSTKPIALTSIWHGQQHWQPINTAFQEQQQTNTPFFYTAPEPVEFGKI
ncbi:CD9 antigen-like isoform X1 [Microcaecilia unicolor]|nr:CD9 antigen-like isoform X1 [Microcaecilia unicolor]